ncbi:hypothetical protein SBA4_3130003 [Candidatus Sulfopaludibacter sp. SbA4]|nr:hypothetical protein SBA4_3130003 [Candidatus Sulfopaludibacter sp. SbA4]
MWPATALRSEERKNRRLTGKQKRKPNEDPVHNSSAREEAHPVPEHRMCGRSPTGPGNEAELLPSNMSRVMICIGSQ